MLFHVCCMDGKYMVMDQSIWFDALFSSSLLFASRSAATPRGDHAIATALVSTTVIVDPRRSIDAKYPNTIHNGEFPRHLDNPQNDVCDADVKGIIGKMAGRIAQDSGNDKQAPLDV